MCSRHHFPWGGFLNVLVFLWLFDLLALPYVKLPKCRYQRFRKPIDSELRRTVDLKEWSTDNSKGAAIVDDVSTLPNFHARQDGLDQPKGAKEVDIKCVLRQVH